MGTIQQKKPILARNLWRGIGKQGLGSEQGRKEGSKPAIGVNPGGRLFHARLLQGIVYKNLDSLLYEWILGSLTSGFIEQKNVPGNFALALYRAIISRLCVTAAS